MVQFRSRGGPAIAYQPLALRTRRDLGDGKWQAGVEAEAATKARNVGIQGSGGTDHLMKRGCTSYVLTDAGVSATATIAVLRAQPYSIE